MSGNRTPGVCVTGRNVTNYTNTESEPPARIELATLRLLSACSARLSYRGVFLLPTRIELATLGL